MTHDTTQFAVESIRRWWWQIGVVSVAVVLVLLRLLGAETRA